MKKIFTLLTTAAMLCNMFAVTSFAEESDKPTSNTAITAAKTAQWRATESDSATYDLPYSRLVRMGNGGIYGL